MSLLARILDKIGLEHSATADPDAVPAPAPAPANSMPTPTFTAPTTDLELSARLDAMAARHPEPLDWKLSILDLLTLLELDNSLAARKELATELGCPAEKLGDAAQMNSWLHKALLRKLAANTGDVRAEPY